MRNDREKWRVRTGGFARKGFFGGMMLLVAALGLHAATGFADARLHVQIDCHNITAKSLPLYLGDARAAGADAVQITCCSLTQAEDERRQTLETLRTALAAAEKAGFATAVWTSSFGYGARLKGPPSGPFAHSTRLTALDGIAHRDAICPLDPDLRAALARNVRDFIAAGARFILWDDDYIQCGRHHICCTCLRHLALVRRRIGRDVTPADIRASFCGGPNALRTAFLDANREAMVSLARELRAVADAVAPGIGMGLCATYTLYDIEGTDAVELVSAFAGDGPKLLRLSGATYWPYAGSERYPGQGLDGVLESMRFQANLLRGRGLVLLDENDPCPRRAEVVPPWATELFDKATIALGGVVRNKYILRYPADRSEQGYLFAHLENKRDDVRLAGIFAGTEDCGWRVVFPEHTVRTAELPATFGGERHLMNVFSFPVAAHFLARNGCPVAFAGEGPSVAFGHAAAALDDAAMRRGVLLDRSAAQVLAKRGLDVGLAACATEAPLSTHVDAQGRRFAVLGFDGWALDFVHYRSGAHREALSAARAFLGFAEPCRVESAAHIYQIVKRDPATGELAVLVENLSDAPTDVKIVVDGGVRIVDSLRGEFKPISGGVVLDGLAPHAYAAVRFQSRKGVMP